MSRKRNINKKKVDLVNHLTGSTYSVKKKKGRHSSKSVFDRKTIKTVKKDSYKRSPKLKSRFFSYIRFKQLPNARELKIEGETFLEFKGLPEIYFSEKLFYDK